MSLPINTIRTGTDDFALVKTGLIISNTPLDCTTFSSVSGFTITGLQPTNSDRRVAFKVDGTWYKLSDSGSMTLAALTTQSITLVSLLAEGNAVADISGATSIAGFVGKSVYVAIALTAPGDAVTLPTLQIAINGVAASAQTSYSRLSGIVNLSSTPMQIINLAANVTATGGASAAVTVSLQKNGSWGSYIDLNTAALQYATALQFKATYTVPSVGTGSAIVNSVSVLCRTNTASVSGNLAEIISITENFAGVGMRFGRITVKHQLLQDAEIGALISLNDIPSTRDKINIGTGNGSRLTLDLKPSGAASVDTGINHNTLRLWFGSSEVFDFDFDTATSQVSATAPNGVTLFASYTYNWEPEIWVAMTAGSTQKYDEPNIFGTEFTFELPSGQAGKGVSAMKIQLIKPAGTVTNASLGTATGSTQMIVLSHAAVTSSIVVTASTGSASWSYNPISRVLSVVGNSGATLTISYNWNAETPICYGFVAAWSE